MSARKRVDFYVPTDHGAEIITGSTSNLLPYLARTKYPENTLAVYHTGNGTHVYRKRYQGQWEFVRQTIGPTS